MSRNMRILGVDGNLPNDCQDFIRVQIRRQNRKRLCGGTDSENGFFLDTVTFDVIESLCLNHVLTLQSFLFKSTEKWSVFIFYEKGKSEALESGRNPFSLSDGSVVALIQPC